MKIAHSTIDSHLEKGLENIYTVFGNETLFIQETIEKINESWGGDFQITYLNSWKSFIKKRRSGE